MRLFLGPLVAGMLLNASMAFAQATELKLFEKKVQKYAVSPLEIFAGKRKGLCGCISDGNTANNRAAGVVASSVFNGRVQVNCWVPAANAEGEILLAEVCDNWVPLAK